MVDAVLVHQLPDADAIVSSFSRKLQSELLIVLGHFSLENWMPVQIQGVSSIRRLFWSLFTGMPTRIACHLAPRAGGLTPCEGRPMETNYPSAPSAFTP